MTETTPNPETCRELEDRQDEIEGLDDDETEDSPLLQGLVEALRRCLDADFEGGP